MSRPVPRLTSGVLRSKGGFSLIELLLTVLFVTLGSQLIQGGFLRAAHFFGRYEHTLQAILWSDEQTALDRENILKNEFESGSPGGVLQISGKEMPWTGGIESAAGRNLFVSRRSLTWQESGKTSLYTKELYVYQRDASQA